MKRLATYLIFLMLVMEGMAQNRTFNARDSRLKVYYGDTVSIQADSAYVVSAAQALLLNEKLQALQDAQRHHLQLQTEHTRLLEKVGEIEEQVTRLLGRMQSDHKVMESNLVRLLTELDASIAILEQANSELVTNNEELEGQLSTMDDTVKHLRQENRRMAWKQTLDKIVVAAAALGLGFLLGSL